MGTNCGKSLKEEMGGGVDGVHQRGREEGEQWRQLAKREEFDKGQRLVRTRQWPMLFQEGWGHAYHPTKPENTEKVGGKGRQKPVQSAGNTTEIIRNQPAMRGRAFILKPDQ